MNIHLRSLQWKSVDVCEAVFQRDGGGDATVVFHLERTSVGVGATPHPDVFQQCHGSAHDVRAVVAAVVQFCLVAQGEAG